MGNTRSDISLPSLNSAKVLDFDETITKEHTFAAKKLDGPTEFLGPYQEGRQDAALNIKAGIKEQVQHDDNHLLAIATYHNNPDYVAGTLSAILGKPITLLRRILSPQNPQVAINQYNVEGTGRPLFVSYIPDYGQAFNDKLTQLHGKNEQLGFLRQLLTQESQLDENGIINYYDDSINNLNHAASLPYMSRYHVDRNNKEQFSVIDTRPYVQPQADRPVTREQTAAPVQQNPSQTSESTPSADFEQIGPYTLRRPQADRPVAQNREQTAAPIATTAPIQQRQSQPAGPAATADYEIEEIAPNILYRRLRTAQEQSPTPIEPAIPVQQSSSSPIPTVASVRTNDPLLAAKNLKPRNYLEFDSIAERNKAIKSLKALGIKFSDASSLRLKTDKLFRQSNVKPTLLEISDSAKQAIEKAKNELANDPANDHSSLFEAKNKKRNVLKFNTIEERDKAIESFKALGINRSNAPSLISKDETLFRYTRVNPTVLEISESAKLVIEQARAQNSLNTTNAQTTPIIIDGLVTNTPTAPPESDTNQSEAQSIPLITEGLVTHIPSAPSELPDELPENDFYPEETNELPEGNFNPEETKERPSSLSPMSVDSSGLNPTAQKSDNFTIQSSKPESKKSEEIENQPDQQKPS